MKNDRYDNVTYYKDTFDEIHVPETLFGKVMDMSMEKGKWKRQRRLKFAGSIVGALALCMVISNGVCYAATGGTWVSKVTLYINGENVTQDVTWHKDDDGNMYGRIGTEEGDCIFYDKSYGEDVSYQEAVVTSVQDMQSEIVCEGDKQYLIIGDSKIDITEDFADGRCSGTFELEGVTFQYEVTGNVEEYQVSIQ